MYLQSRTVVSELNQNLGFPQLIAGCLAITEFRITEVATVANEPKFTYVTAGKVRHWYLSYCQYRGGLCCCLEL